MRVLLYFIFGLILFLPSLSYADCDLGMGNGTRPEGKTVFNTAYQVVQTCKSDGQWHALGPINCPAGDGCPPPPTGCPSVGDLCSDGSYYANISPDGGVKMYMTDSASETSAKWAQAGTVTGFTDAADGDGNTAGMVALGDAGAPYDAAVYCDNLIAHGHSDWYLPARNELWNYWNGGSTFGGIKTDGTWYWAATEDTASNAQRQQMSSGFQGDIGKTTAQAVRCARKE